MNISLVLCYHLQHVPGYPGTVGYGLFCDNYLHVFPVVYGLFIVFKVKHYRRRSGYC